MSDIRNYVLLGEAGCGKSELAINLACRLLDTGKLVDLFDLDMTKPLFRTREQADTLSLATASALDSDGKHRPAPCLRPRARYERFPNV